MRRNFFQNSAYTELNITPLMDLAWNLLVVFIIAVTATVQGIKVNLPKASNKPVISKSRTKAITITAEGQVYLDAYLVTLEELQSRLRQFKDQDPDLPVVVKGDQSISYQLVVDVLDILERLDITQLGLVTQKIVK